jgi:NitT/TauT family transport system ATP-binding protein
VSRPALEVEDLVVRYAGANRPTTTAIDGVSFAVLAGELVALLGPSGSGKSTLLRCIAGLAIPTAGSVRIGGEVVTDVPPRMAIVFQDYGRSLYPWLTAQENVELPLRHQGLPAHERRQRAGEALAEVGLSDAGDRHPWELSGGMQQRVAIARAIAYRPQILLMDEPFASVDAQTRADLQDMTLALWAAHGSTVLFVTHDIDESVYLADRLIVLTPTPGRIAADLRAGLPRPRDQVETRASLAFVERRAEVARLVRRGPAPGLPSAR